MPAAATPSMGAPTPKGSRLDRQKIEAAARPLASQIIKRFEDLVAAGFELNGSPMVLNGGCFLRDLAPITLSRTLALVSPVSGTGASPAPEARRADPIALTLSQEKARDARRDATAATSTAYAINHHLKRQAERLAANPVIPRAYTAAREALQTRAAAGLALDVRRFDRARDAEHRAHGLPALRPRSENASLHRTKEGHRRYPRL